MIDDYYKGFEGYPEIDFYTYINEEKTGIEMWEGYFDKIMNELSPVDGKWVSLAYFYHLDEGWYDESPWVIPDNKKALEQFETIEIKVLDNVTQEIILKLIKLLKDNLDSEIFIEYS
ncbi:dihydroorotate dehydrogenase (quinone) [Listeria welshimeri]|nr:dihydroorotate dehydrogenase (quinone) [Listeria welshimeri]MBF2703818.1 dihydroorotate dehydrogenase (quinone) [Listeria welshimeri]